MLKQILASFFMTVVAFSVTQAQNYKTAVGLRLSSNDATINHSVSVKQFINKVVAMEALFSLDPAAVGLLAEVHQPLSSAPGLRWLFGGGGYIGFKNGISLGAQGILGLDYKFLNVPLNLSVDWKPELDFTNEFRFEPAAVGLTVRFTLR